MKRTTFATALFLLCSLAFSSLAFAADDAKLEAAKRYLASAPVSSMINETAQKMAGSLPENERERFISLMTRLVDQKRIEEAVLDAMVRTFTAEELNAFADFYGSEVGKSAMSKFGDYMSLVMPVMQHEMVRAAKAAR